MNADKDKPGLRGILSDQDAKIVGDEWRANPPYADKDTATPQSAIKDAERLASVLIGRFPIACEGRHFEGRTCDYCLVDNILRLLRQALDTEGPHNLSESAQRAGDADHTTGNTICPNCAHDFDAHILAVNAYDAHRQLAEAARRLINPADPSDYRERLPRLRTALAAVDAVGRPLGKP